ncbi:MAG: homoserine kinase [Armatimonadetes bacterium]|nr:homoserine kinase [Armatimonadota bacterium]
MSRNTPLQQHDIHKLAGKYALTEVGFEPIEGGANSSYALHTHQGDYVLTVFDEKSWADVVKIGQLLLLLADCEFPTTRLVPPTKGGLATMYRDKPVMLKEYIVGHVFKDLDKTMVSQVGVAMARLHQVPAPDFLPDKHPYGLQVFSRVIDRNINPTYESWLAEQLAYLARSIPSHLPRGLIHGDMFYDNVLFEGRELRAIIDFEEACHYYGVFDLGMGIVGLCADETTIALDRARALVNGYQQVKCIEEREKEALQLFVEYAATATSYWRFWAYQIYTPTARKANKYRQMVGLAEEVRAIPKERFLEAIFD